MSTFNNTPPEDNNTTRPDLIYGVPEPLPQTYSNIMTLKIFIKDENLRNLYINHVNENFNNVYSDYPDAGFDLFIPTELTIQGNTTQKIKLGIKCAAFTNGLPQSFYMYPRSSISKTPLRLANCVGIIDSGYRGELCAMVDNIRIDDITINGNMRLFQICAPNLNPIKVEIVHSEDVLGLTTRGTGGFGSTGGTI